MSIVRDFLRETDEQIRRDRIKSAIDRQNEILTLAHSNPVIYAALSAMREGRLTWPEAMEMCVLELARINTGLEEVAMRAYRESPTLGVFELPLARARIEELER